MAARRHRHRGRSAGRGSILRRRVQAVIRRQPGTVPLQVITSPYLARRDRYAKRPVPH